MSRFDINGLFSRGAQELTRIGADISTGKLSGKSISDGIKIGSALLHNLRNALSNFHSNLEKLSAKIKYFSPGTIRKPMESALNAVRTLDMELQNQLQRRPTMQSPRPLIALESKQKTKKEGMQRESLKSLLNTNNSPSPASSEKNELRGILNQLKRDIPPGERRAPAELRELFKRHNEQRKTPQAQSAKPQQLQKSKTTPSKSFPSPANNQTTIQRANTLNARIGRVTELQAKGTTLSGTPNVINNQRANSIKPNAAEKLERRMEAFVAENQSKPLKENISHRTTPKEQTQRAAFVRPQSVAEKRPTSNERLRSSTGNEKPSQKPDQIRHSEISLDTPILKTRADLYTDAFEKQLSPNASPNEIRQFDEDQATALKQLNILDKQDAWFKQQTDKLNRMGEQFNPDDLLRKRESLRWKQVQIEDKLARELDSQFDISKADDDPDYVVNYFNSPNYDPFKDTSSHIQNLQKEKEKITAELEKLEDKLKQFNAN